MKSSLELNNKQPDIIPKIFDNRFTLKLSSLNFENVFQQKIQSSQRKWNPYLIIVNFIVITAMQFIIEFNSKISPSRSNDERYKRAYFIIRVFSFLLCIFCIFQLIFLYFNTKYQQLNPIYSLLNYLIFSLGITQSQKIVFNLYSIPSEWFAFWYYVDFLLQWIILFSHFFDFFNFFIANVIILVIENVYNAVLYSWCINTFYNWVSSNIWTVSLIVVSYFFIKNQKGLLALYLELQEKGDLYSNICENIKYGWINYSNKKWSANKYIKDIAKKFLKNELNNNEDNLENILLNAIIKRTNSVLKLKTAVNDRKNSLQDVNVELTGKNVYGNNTNWNYLSTMSHLNVNKESVFNQQSTACINEIIQLLVDCNAQDKEFKFIGSGSFVLDDKDTNNTNKEINPEIFYFELFICSYSHCQDKSIEFLIRDITSSKEIEQKDIEIHVKSRVFTKIAHEFKNPLLCWSSLLDGYSDKQITTSSSDFSWMQSISIYLLMLTKNIDHFIKYQDSLNEKDTQIECSYDYFATNDVIQFIKLMANFLLLKYNKSNTVQFKTVVNGVPDIIYSDEIKIKQILWNLISNSIKFTSAGTVTLQINIEKSKYLKFTVTDTGRGIPKVNENKIFDTFTPVFTNDNTINKFGSGIGWSIVKDLTKALGHEIELSSTPEKGSSFWFYCNYENNAGLLSEKSEKCDDFIKIANSPIENKPNNNPEKHLITQHHQIYSNETIIVKNLELYHDEVLPVHSKQETTFNKKEFTIVIVDDQELIRKSMIRSIDKYFKKMECKINIIEASDGVELLYWVYKHVVRDNKKIDLIISDEDMTVYNGIKTSRKLSKIEKKIGIKHIKYCLSSTYSWEGDYKECIDCVFHKPLLGNDLKQIFEIIKDNEASLNDNEINLNSVNIQYI